MSATTTAEGEQQLLFRFGPQTVTFEPPLIARLKFTEPVLPQDLFALVDVMRAALDKQKHLFLLIDVSGIREIHANLRGLGVKSVLPYDAMAIVGASFAVRVALSMITRAARVLDPHGKISFPLEFFKTEEEALAWLRERAGA